MWQATAQIVAGTYLIEQGQGCSTGETDPKLEKLKKWRNQHYRRLNNISPKRSELLIEIIMVDGLRLKLTEEQRSPGASHLWNAGPLLLSLIVLLQYFSHNPRLSYQELFFERSTASLELRWSPEYLKPAILLGERSWCKNREFFHRCPLPRRRGREYSDEFFQERQLFQTFWATIDLQQRWRNRTRDVQHILTFSRF